MRTEHANWTYESIRWYTICWKSNTSVSIMHRNIVVPILVYSFTFLVTFKFIPLSHAHIIFCRSAIWCHRMKQSLCICQSNRSVLCIVDYCFNTRLFNCEKKIAVGSAKFIVKWIIIQVRITLADVWTYNDDFSYGNQVFAFRSQ